MAVTSIKPKKQRLFQRTADMHQKGRFLHATLAKPLRQKYGSRSLRVRTGDSVTVMRGSFAGKEGKVERVDTRRLAVYIDKIEVFKKDGSKAVRPIHPSNLMITELSDDKKRLKRRLKGESA